MRGFALCTLAAWLAVLMPAVGQDLPAKVDGPKVSAGFLAGRSGATREKMLREAGGTAESEAAVALGLQWLIRQQAADGSWTLEGPRPDKMAGTALALLPLLGAGQTHLGGLKPHPYGKQIQRGLDFLVENQGRGGELGANIFVHSLATLAVAEAYGMTADVVLKEPAQRAITYLVNQQKPAGHWEGNPAGAGRGVTFGAWCVQALTAGRNAGLDIPKETWARLNQYLDSTSTGQGDAKDAAMTAPHMFCRMSLTPAPAFPALIRAVEQLRQKPPRADLKDLDYYYFSTSIMRSLRNTRWDEWNPVMRGRLIAAQSKDKNKPDLEGSWDPAGDPLAAYGGRLMQTSLSILTLETYYRIPLLCRDPVPTEIKP